MGCSIDVLVIALQLARGLVVDPVPTRGFSVMTTECNPVKCGGTPLEVAAWNLMRAEEQDRQERARAADYKEFQRLAGICTPKGKR